MRKIKNRTRPNRADALGTTALRLRFIDEYMVDRNGTQAAIRAGYSPATAPNVSWRILKLPEIRDEIDRRTKDAAEKADISTVEILRDLKRVAQFDIRTLFKDGRVITDPSHLPDDVARGLVDFDIVVLNKEGDYIIKLNPGNKMKALELLGKYKKMFVDRVESTEKRTVTFTTDFGDEDQKPDEESE